MGTVTGTTQDRLSLVKTYNPAQPYVVGVNGVTDVYTDAVGRGHVKYIIDGIEYHTTLTKDFNDLNKPLNLTKTALNINSPIGGNKSYIPQSDIKNGTFGGRLPGGDIVYPTTFRYTTQPYTDITSYFVFKDEVKMGVVFTPKVDEEVFIERQSEPVYEPQIRLGEINLSVAQLEDYNNGYYNIIKSE